ncbi:MAG: aspartate ammonia-lyase [Deltaproteobacteria bacterium]|nr:aspartate ammonia-lyase [Deltaproteobacteria bacterium]
MRCRTEKDTLGARCVPADVYYGIQTLRAQENFRISSIAPKREFINSTAMIKMAAAKVNSTLGLLPRKKARAIIRACREIIRGEFHDQFIVDVYQAGAGTSHNMNSNEVIANRAIELLGGKRGDYSVVHPNDHVNMGQSTNDTVPTAMRLAAIFASRGLLHELRKLENAFMEKACSFDTVIKSARTHLQDAVPIRLGQEFSSYSESVGKCGERLLNAAGGLKTLSIGGTAAGTGMNAHPRYRRMMIRSLAEITGIRGLRPSPDMVEATSSMAGFTEFSGALKVSAIELIRISNDIRLLSSGPRTGLSEITLPAIQPGSSIMPGKVNPVMAEMLGMVCFQVIGNDTAVTMAAQAGQLELNVMTPVINYNILQSTGILTNAVKAFTGRCVRGIKADRKKCRAYFEKSVGIAAVLNPYIGYEKAALVAKEALAKGLTIREVILQRRILSKKKLDGILDPMKVTGKTGWLAGKAGGRQGRLIGRRGEKGK